MIFKKIERNELDDEGSIGFEYTSEHNESQNNLLHFYFFNFL